MYYHNQFLCARVLLLERSIIDGMIHVCGGGQYLWSMGRGKRILLGGDLLWENILRTPQKCLLARTTQWLKSSLADSCLAQSCLSFGLVFLSFCLLSFVFLSFLWSSYFIVEFYISSSLFIGIRQGPRSEELFGYQLLILYTIYIYYILVFVQLNQYSQILRRQCCLVLLLFKSSVSQMAF